MSMDVFYASHFGHTERIARTLARIISQSGVPARARNLAEDYPSEGEIRSQDPCVLISPIRYGVHLAKARRLLRRIAPLTPRKPLFLFSVNLTARKEGKTSRAGNVYLRRWISASGARPLLAEAIAGKLEYPRYNIFDRTMIRVIMTVTGGPADGKSVIDYTPWTHVAELATQIAEAAKPLCESAAHASDESRLPAGGRQR
jgi:menaquinone-dependent protoporphyrinogen oxidase